jgi:transposase
MLLLPKSVQIFVAVGATDLRNSIDGLSALVRNHFKRDAFSGHLFVFIGKRRDKLKMLAWGVGGFVLYYKRLEQGRFRLPQGVEGEAVAIDSTTLSLMLDGIDMAKVRRPKHWVPQKNHLQVSGGLIEDSHVAPSR